MRGELMDDAALLVAAAERLGYRAEDARAALAWASARLAGRGLLRAPYYLFRGGGGGAGSGGGGAGRPRLLLAFPSADAALGFAQRRGLGAAPRLLGLGLAPILATLAQRPAIEAALFVDEAAAEAGPLPGGLRLERAELIARLAGALGAIGAAGEGEKLV